MVETLGVLAVVGVLSIAALVGIKQVVHKYKSQKQIEQINILFNAVYKRLPQLYKIKHAQNLNDTFIKLGEIPPDMKPNAGYIYDVFKTPYCLYRQFYSATSAYIGIFMRIPHLTSCVNTFHVAKEHWRDKIYNFETTQTKVNHVTITYFGDNYCSGTTTIKCLKDITEEEIYSVCEGMNAPSGYALIRLTNK